MAARKRPAVEVTEIPDVLGQEGFVDARQNSLMRIAAMKRELQLTMVANDHEEGEMIPGILPPISYKDRRIELGKSEQRLGKTFPDELEKLKKRLEAREVAS